MSDGKKYSYTKFCNEISGFGGGYENACRQMVIAGMEWLDDHPEADPKYSEFKNVFGLTTNENDDCKNLQKAMNEAIDNEASGAMMQACLSHILYARDKGWENYIKKMELPDKEEKVN
jgi:hypothetical protein